MAKYTKYLYMVEGGTRTVELTAEEEAAILAAYDYGIPMMGHAEIQVLHAVLAKLKDVIYP